MIKKFRARFSSAHLVALLALFVVLGGSAYAVKKNSVGSKQIKNNAVTNSKIKAGAVTTDKLADNAATGAKVDEGSLSKVPSATTADTATNAANATNATNATTAANATNFAGFGLGQVRSVADGSGSAVAVNLPILGFATVLGDDVSIPTGGADYIATATMELENVSAGTVVVNCQIRDDSGTFSQTYNQTIEAGDISNLAITAVETANSGVTEDVDVLCNQTNGVANDVRFNEGELTVQVTPDD